MPVRAVLHAVSRAVSPVPKPTFTDDDSNSGYYRDQPRYQPPEPRSPPAGPGAASSIYSHESWTAQSLNGLQNGQHEDHAPPLPPRRAEHAAMPRIEISAQDYEPPPGPPPGYFNNSAPPSTTPSPPVSSPRTPELKASRDLFSTPAISDFDARGNTDYDNDNMKLGELIPALVAPHLPPRPRSSDATPAAPRTLPKPIAIPSVNTELGSPYMRAYPPCLGDHGIPQDAFLRFLDRLNRVSAASPPVVMLGLGASVVSLIPEPTTAIVATAVDLTCQVSVYAISKGRTEILLAEANREIFGPRGLKVQIAKLEAVARIAGIPVLDDEGKLLSSNPEKQKKKKKDVDGTIAPPTRLLAPLEDIHEVHTLSAQHRRLRALAPWTMPLEFDGLPDVYAVAQEGDLDEAQAQSQEKDNNGGGGISAMGKLHQYVSDYQRKTGEEKLIKGRKKALDRLTESRQKAQEKYEKKLRELEKDESRLQEKIIKKTDSNSSTKSEEKELEKIVTKKAVTLPEELEKEMEKIQRKYEKDDQEEKGIRRIHYLIVTDKDDIERQTDKSGLDAEKVGELAKQGNLDVPQKTF